MVIGCCGWGLVLEFSPTSYTYYSAKPEEKTQEEEHVRNEVAVQRPIIDDTTIGILSNKTFGDVFSLQGKEDLKEELRQAINARLENLEVLRVYVTDFLVQ